MCLYECLYVYVYKVLHNAIRDLKRKKREMRNVYTPARDATAADHQTNVAEK